GALAGAAALLPAFTRGSSPARDTKAPILVAVELSGGNDGLNSIVPHGDDAYYRARPTIGIRQEQLLPLDDHFGFNPGMLGLQRLWQDGQLAIVHGCGYEQASYSHFTSMAYWHTGAPHSGDSLGWMGRTADAMAPTYRDDMLINVAPSQSLAVRSAIHTPLVFDNPGRFQRKYWLGGVPPSAVPATAVGNANLDFLHALDRSAQTSSSRIRAAWARYKSSVDYGIAPMDLPKVAACIDAGLPTQLYYVQFRNNAFDTHVAQPALHRRLLSYACDGIHGFVKDLQRLGHADRVVVMVFSEFGRRVPENANLGTDHGSANVMLLAGQPIKGGHYGKLPSLTDLIDGDNLRYTTDFRQVYATAIEGWLGVDAQTVLHEHFATLPVFA
ncbi:MAG: DUF1501 domain-containing protein, partial [Pseudomonadota bacterium]